MSHRQFYRLHERHSGGTHFWHKSKCWTLTKELFLRANKIINECTSQITPIYKRIWFNDTGIKWNGSEKIKKWPHGQPIYSPQRTVPVIQRQCKRCHLLDHNNPSNSRLVQFHQSSIVGSQNACGGGGSRSKSNIV